MKYAVIQTSRIKTSNNHNKLRCKDGEIVTLAKSIYKLGVIEPITVKPLSGGEAYEIISGNRRFCASVLAGIKEIPCIITDRNDNNKLMEISLMRFSNHDPFIIADKIKQILIEKGWSAETLADNTGMEISEIIDYLSPGKMSDIEREMARNFKISNEMVRKISHLSDREPRIREMLKFKRVTHSEYNKPKVKQNIKARRRISFSGLGFFENTIKKSLELLEKAGIRTKHETEERGNEIEYKIKLRK